MLGSDTVLVTGGAGFIGSHTVDLLLAKGYRVKILDNLSKPVHTDEWPDYLPKYVEKILGTVESKSDWEKALDGVDFVIHLAAHQDYLPQFSKFFNTNTVGTSLLYEVINEKKLNIEKVIIASSQAVYGEGNYMCQNDRCSFVHTPYKANYRSESQLKEKKWDILCPNCKEPMDSLSISEKDIVDPYNPYAISKYTQELIALSFGKRYNIATSCLRYSIVQGPRQSFRNAYSGILRIFTQRILQDLPIIIYEDGYQKRDYVSVYDVARANILTMENHDSDWKSYNVGGTNIYTVLEYANQIAPGAEIEIPNVYRFGDVRHIYSNCKSIKDIGWSPEVRLPEIIQGYLTWATAQSDFKDYTKEANKIMDSLKVIRSTDA